jgi:hypothetical protein
VKRRRGSQHQRRIDEPAAQQALLHRIADELGVGVLVSVIDEGPPVRITATLVFGILRSDVTVEGSDEATAWRELARAAAAWRQSNEVSFTRTFWGG